MCPNCENENPFYALNCKNCKAYLRARVVNIELWQFIGKLIESPITGFKNIIHAEHKNFVIILTLLLGIKYFLNAIIFSQTININLESVNFLTWNLILSEGYLIVSLILFSLIITLLNRAFGLINRFRDNFSIYIFSTIPLLFAMVFLVPVEFALFGKYWFIFNPPPYVIKPLEFWVIFSLEGLMILWTLLLAIFGTYSHTRGKIYSMMIGILFLAVLFGGMIYLPLLPF